MSELRLAVVINSLGTGGAETQLVSVLPELPRRGWTVTVVTLMRAGPVAHDLESAGIPVRSLDLGRRSPAWLAAPTRLAKELADFGATVVHAHLTQATLVTRLASLLGPRWPLVDSIHYTEGERQWRAWAYRATQRLSDRTAVLSDQARMEQLRLRAVPPSKLVVVNNGLDTRRFTTDADRRNEARRKLELNGEFVWLTVGRMVEEKDQPRLLEAFSRVHGQRPQSRLFIVGDGPMRDSLLADIEARGLVDAVRLTGELRDVRTTYAAADGFVLSSRREGLPMALLEAMSMELPVAATRVGSIPDVVVTDESGVLVDPEQPDALADAMLRVGDLSPADRTWMGRQARDRVVRHFSASATAARWDSLYRSLLDGAAQTSPVRS